MAASDSMEIANMHMRVNRKEEQVNDAMKMRKTMKVNRAMLLGFIQKCSCDSTLHGIRYVFESEAFVIRKILWLLVIVACAGFCAQQFYERVTKFMSNPQTVDFDIIYTHEHDFPQVTICNNNVFKSTKVYPPSAYESLSKLFKLDSYLDPQFIQYLEDTDRQLFTTTGSYINLTQDYINSGHNVKDLISVCRFRGRSCSHENFVMVFTDYGPCYQFVGDGKPLVVTNAGVGTGLTLELNVEQYAYMVGPRYSAGVIVLMQAVGEVPIVEGRAVALPAGGEVFVGLDLTKVDLLPPPIGDCSNKELRYFSEYSVSACQLECLTEYVIKNCDCKMGFMPGDTPQCRIARYFGCAFPFSKNFTLSNDADNCTCPPSCSEKIYLPSITFAPSSHFAAKSYTPVLNKNSQLLLDYVTAKAVFDYHFNETQRSEDNATLVRFAPFLSNFSSATNALYPKLNAMKEIFSNSNFTQAMLVKVEANFDVAIVMQSIINMTENITSLIKSVDPAVYWYNHKITNLAVMEEHLMLLLGCGARIWLFNEFRIDSIQKNNATTLLFLNETFLGTMQIIEQRAQTVTQFVASRNLTDSALDAIAANVSYSLAQLRIANAIFERSLQYMIARGLPAMNNHIAHDIPRMESFTFDGDFVRSNYMKVEIFFKEMRYQQIQKILSDSFVSLICDLGGTFGLCLGASIMTVYEFFDFFICYLRIRSMK